MCCYTELEFTLQQLSFSVLCLVNLQLQGYSCGQFYLDLFSTVSDKLPFKSGCFFLNTMQFQLARQKL